MFWSYPWNVMKPTPRTNLTHFSHKTFTRQGQHMHPYLFIQTFCVFCTLDAYSSQRSASHVMMTSWQYCKLLHIRFLVTWCCLNLGLKKEKSLTFDGKCCDSRFNPGSGSVATVAIVVTVAKTLTCFLSPLLRWVGFPLALSKGSDWALEKGGKGIFFV